jgi:CubicO group peptidase (beta-lactamase class C family)
MTGAVPATYTCRPTRTAREKPTTGSYGDPEEMSLRSTRLVSPAVDALAQIDGWPVETKAAGVVKSGRTWTHGPEAAKFKWASVTKLFTAMAVLVAAEEGVLDLDEPAGPPGATVRHLLAHASGLPFDGARPISEPGKRRIYSNTGFDALGDLLGEKAEMTFGEYLAAAVLEPLALSGTTLEGAPSAGLAGTLSDLLVFARELMEPTLVAEETLEEATTVVFPGLAGILPDFGRYEPLDWGLGFEIRDAKEPHWTGTRNSGRTFGHFGGSGSFVWVDPEAGLACASLADRQFGQWAKDAWPAVSDAVLAELG